MMAVYSFYERNDRRRHVISTTVTTKIDVTPYIMTDMYVPHYRRE
jgi:hypothetical protein